jgi:hypothetical protein
MHEAEQAVRHFIKLIDRMAEAHVEEEAGG